MFENNLDVIRETHKFRYEDILQTRRGYFYREEKFVRGKRKNLLAPLQRFFTSLIKILQVPRPSYGPTHCVFGVVEC